MSQHRILDLRECQEFRLSLQARPPAVVHGLALLMAAGVVTALVWAAATRVDLVARGVGRVRPEEAPTRVFLGENGQGSPGGPAARVIAVNYRQGDGVRQGDVLVRLDAERLDNDILKVEKAIRAGQDDLAQIDSMEKALEAESRANRAKAEAELANAVEEVRQRKEKQAGDNRLAELDRDRAKEEEQRMLQLLANQAASQEETARASVAARQAEEVLRKAQMPVNEGEVEVRRRALDLADKEEALKREDLHMKRSLRRTEVEAARLELANLELERKQTVLSAPMDGVVTSAEVKVGDVLEPGRPVVEIAEQKGFRFEVAVPSDEVSHIRTGMPVRVKLDVFDTSKDEPLPGTVVFIAPDSDAPGRSEGDHSALYLVRIALYGDAARPGASREKIKLGMTGRVEIVTGRESLLWLLLKQVRRSISLG